MTFIRTVTGASRPLKALAGAGLIVAITGGVALAAPAQADPTPAAPAVAVLVTPPPTPTPTPATVRTALRTYVAAQAAPAATVPVDHLASVTPSSTPPVSTLPKGTSLPTDPRITYRTVVRDYTLSDNPAPGVSRMSAGPQLPNVCGADFAAEADAQLTPISGAPVFVQSLVAAYHNLPQNQSPEYSTVYVARTDGNAFARGDDFSVRLTVTCASTTGGAKFWHTSFATPNDAGGSSYTRNQVSSSKYLVKWANACDGGTSVGAGWLIQPGRSENPADAQAQQAGPFFVTDLKGGGSGFRDTAQVAIANLRGKNLDMTPDPTTQVGRDDVVEMSGYCYSG